MNVYARLTEAEREALTCDCGTAGDDPTWPEMWCPFHADKPHLDVYGTAGALVATAERIKRDAYAAGLAAAAEADDRCPECRHAPHSSLGFCPNMASDNDCDCTFAESPAIPDEAVQRIKAEVEHWRGMYDDAMVQLRVAIRETTEARAKCAGLSDLAGYHKARADRIEQTPARTEDSHEADRLRERLTDAYQIAAARREEGRRFYLAWQNARVRAAVARDEADRLREGLTALHQPIRVYDECEHDADHGCEPVEVYDYIGCSESVIGWGCAVCCYDDEYPREDCPHGADHRGVAREASCPTHALLADPAPEGGDRDCPG